MTDTKKTTIPDSFECPAATAVLHGGFVYPDAVECEAFAFDWFCPYSSMAVFESRRLNRDCRFAPADVWLHIKTYEERIELWMEEGV